MLFKTKNKIKYFPTNSKQITLLPILDLFQTDKKKSKNNSNKNTTNKIYLNFVF